MLNELNAIGRDLLGLHGYPVVPSRPSAPARPDRCEREPKAVGSARTRLARSALVVAKVAIGPSAMGHVHW